VPWLAFLAGTVSEFEPLDVATIPHSPFAVGRFRVRVLTRPVSLLFWYMGIVPELQRPESQQAPVTTGRVTRFLALGWSGSSRSLDADTKKAIICVVARSPPRWFLRYTRCVVLNLRFRRFPGWHTTIFSHRTFRFAGERLSPGSAMRDHADVPTRKDL